MKLVTEPTSKLIFCKNLESTEETSTCDTGHITAEHAFEFGGLLNGTCGDSGWIFKKRVIGGMRCYMKKGTAFAAKITALLLMTASS